MTFLILGSCRVLKRFLPNDRATKKECHAESIRPRPIRLWRTAFHVGQVACQLESVCCFTKIPPE